MRAPRVESFDVFDTALVRRVAVPSDVFRALALRLHAAEPAEARTRHVEEFVAARIAAERAAGAGCEQCSLAEIWAHLARLVPDLPPGCGPRDELAAEHAVLAANPVAAAAIAAARAAGSRVVFTSDTYLPADFVRAELEGHGLARPGDGVYVSSEHRATKASGRLYARLCEHEGVPAHAVRHRGDHPEIDVAMAVRRGLRAQPLDHARLAASERALLAPPFATSLAVARLAGEMRLARLEGVGGPAGPVACLAAGLVAPLAFAWAAWTLGQARRDGVRRLYFLARDGYLARHAAQALAGRFGGIECRYLHLSRQSVLLPSATEPTPGDMPWLRRTFETPRLGSLLAKLDLEVDACGPRIAALAGSAGADRMLTSEDDWDALWAALGDEPLRSTVRERIARRREGALGYLREQGLFDGERWAVVDLGWALTVQAGLQRLLAAGGAATPARGYYLGLHAQRAAPAERGDATALFVDAPADRRALAHGHAIFERVTPLEHIVGWAPHGTVLRYRLENGHWVPECQRSAPHVAGTAELLRDAVARFAERNADIAAEIADPALAAGVTERLVREWFARPTREAVAAVAGLSISEDQDNWSARDLVRAMSLGDALVQWIPGTLRRAAGITRTRYDWPEGAEAAAGPWTRELMRWRRRIAALRSRGT